jgi:hypothetical protein
MDSTDLRYNKYKVGYSSDDILKRIDELGGLSDQ